MASAASVSRLLRPATKLTVRTVLRHTRALPASHRHALRLCKIISSHIPTTTFLRCMTTTGAKRAGLMPHTDEPEAPQEQPAEPPVTQATEIDDDEYHERADDYMEALNERAEELQESREDVEVEYAAGVLSITFPPNGTYVVNKQPPNKQIWLSSPVSGPKRYDYVLAGESMHEKEGGGTGEWVYLKDGTNLTDLLAKELGIVVDARSHDRSSGGGTAS